jgi:D-3-phosphoglycerate dehydrogenase
MTKNKTYKILVTWRLMIKFLKNQNKSYKNIDFDFIQKKQGLIEKELLNIIHKYDGIICGDDQITPKVIDNAKKLKVISKWGTGMDTISVDYAKKNKIRVFNTPNAFSKSVAQLALSFILSFSRHTFETQNSIKKGDWPKYEGFLIKNKIVGIIGFGNIGKSISKLVLKLGMKVIFNDIKKTKKILNKNIKKVTLTKLLKNSDILITSCDLNKSSFNLINKSKLALMKKTSGVINISRGGVINENDLYQFLKKEKIAFGALDVFLKEPINKQNKLINLKNCILSSHNAFNTAEEVRNVNINTLKNIFKGLKI